MIHRAQSANGIVPEQPAVLPPENAAAPTGGPASAPLRELACYAITSYPSDLAVQALALASKLSDDQLPALLRLLRAVDDWVVAEATEAEEATWQQVLAHLPGLRSALEVLLARVRGLEPASTVG
ncbi:MAG TPA: hypothetical protein VK066_07295 [Chloroflexota bacterium]|nr:hypothetical protein [Chloroflexota bacterium]